MAFLGDTIEQLEKPAGAVRSQQRPYPRRRSLRVDRDLFTEVELVFLEQIKAEERYDGLGAAD
jgi:hypothetical protein